MDNKIAGLLTVFSNRGGQPNCTFVYKGAITSCLTIQIPLLTGGYACIGMII